MKESRFESMIRQYLEFIVEGKVVKIPYVLERSRWAFGKSSGKGTPELLLEELKCKAIELDFDLTSANSHQIYDFMRLHRIGVECSGLVFNLLNELIIDYTGKELSDVLLRFPGSIGYFERKLLSYQRYRRINAKTLTSDLNTVGIPSVEGVEVGDMVRMSVNKSADHVLLIIDIHRKDDRVNEIEYIHSSSVHTRKRGPHKGIIRCVRDNAGLEGQEWLEITKDGGTYGRYFHPNKGDGIRRLKIMYVG